MSALEAKDRWDVLPTVVISETVGLVLFVMMALSYPFSGELAVSQRVFATVLREIEHAGP